MPGSILGSRDILRIDRLVYLPVILVLIGIWVVVIDFKVQDRAQVLQLAEEDLFSSANSIADDEALLRENSDKSRTEKDATRVDLIQGEQRTHPGVHIWIESGSEVFGTAVPLDPSSVIHAREEREGFTAYAAIPVDLALADWQQSLGRWITILGILTITALAIAALLARTLRRSAIAERGLRKRDAILKTINDAATALAATEDYETVISDVLRSIGDVIGVDRVNVRELAPIGDGPAAQKRLFEWHRPELASLADTPAIVNAEFGEYYKPIQLAQAMRGEPIRFYIGDAAVAQRDFLIKAGVQSSLVFATIVNGRPYCSLSFADAHNSRREWTEIEVDTLRTLSGVIAAAMTRTQQARERDKAEAKLGNREAILRAINDAASKLAGAENYESVIDEVLASASAVIGVDRTILGILAPPVDGKIVITRVFEWHKPDMRPLSDLNNFLGADFTYYHPPEHLAKLMRGEPLVTYIDEFPDDRKKYFLEASLLSNLVFTIIIDGSPYCSLSISDCQKARREWTPTEIDTLQTLSGVIAAAVKRTHQAQERSKAEAKLGNRDAILQAVTDSAANLLNARDIDAAITETLTALGQALGVSRVYITPLTLTADQRVVANVSHEWFKPGMVPVRTHPAFIDADVTAAYPPERLTGAFDLREEAFRTEDFIEEARAPMLAVGMAAFIAVAVLIDGQFHGNLVFSDDSPDRKSWTPTEIRTLKTLTQLVGAALTRARYVEQRRKAETNLLMRDRALESISQGITIVDLGGRGLPIVYANDAFAAMTRYPLEEILGQLPISFVDPSHAGEAQDRFKQALAEKKPWRLEILVRRKDGSVFLDNAMSTIVTDTSGRVTHWVSIHEDVTELRKREELLLEARKMESVGHLTGGIAHDFNNLLTAVKSNAEDLRDELKDDELLQIQAEIILEAADRGADLVSQLMAFARKQELKPETLAVNETIAAFAKQLERTLPANITMKIDLGADLPMMHVDPGRLEVAIQNLALNARDAMPDGGTITIETAFTAFSNEDAADTAGVRPGSYVLIAVTDSGCGMTREIVDKAFAPFFTTKEVGQGSGLGLSMVYGFVKQSGGYARIYSEVGLGTVVKLYLPVASQMQATREQAIAPSRVVGGGAVLVVEDDIVVRDTTAARLTHLGFQVVAVGNAQEALDALKATPHFDLVFSDVIMPGSMDGADLVREVRRRWPKIGVLLASGYTATTVFAKVNLPPDVQLLSKPYSNSDLATAVRAAMTRTAEKVA
jgi:PAS domain S-box-containing protein